MDHYNALMYPADTGGCGFYRMMFPKLVLQSIARDVKFIESFKTIADSRFYKDIRLVRLQRQVSNHQCDFFLKFLKPLSNAYGFWIVYEIDDCLDFNDIPSYNEAREAYNNDQFFNNIKEMLNASHFVTVTCDKLKDYYVNKYGLDESKVIVIPNYLPRWWIGETYNIKRQEVLFNEQSKRPRIGLPLSTSHYDIKNKNNGIDDLYSIKDFIRQTVDKYEWCFLGSYPEYFHDLALDEKITVLPPSDLLNYPREMWRHKFNAILAPLQDNTFNQCKCVTGDTKIQIKDKGILSIDELITKDEKNIIQDPTYVLADKKFEQAQFTFKSTKKEPIWKIKTSYGFEIKGTHTHKLFCNGEWVEMNKIKTGDIIKLTPFNIEDNIPYQRIKIPCFQTKKLKLEEFKEAETKSIIPQVDVNEDFARLFGYILGDGHFSGKNVISITCCKRDEEVINDVKFLINQTGINPKQYNTSYDKQNHTIICCNSRTIQMFMEYSGLTKRGMSKCLKVPSFIWKSKKSVIKNFLIGLFESDGTVSNESGVSVSFCTIHEQFARDIQLLLTGFNIKSQVIKRRSWYTYFDKKTNTKLTKQTRDHYTIKLSRHNIDIFKEEIGFVSKFKSDRLSIITSKPHSNAFRENTWDDKVVLSQDYGEDYVYDISVPSVQCYSANGILSHNSNIKLLEGWSLGIPTIVSNVECYKGYTDYTFNDANDLQNQLDRLFKSKSRYIDLIKNNRNKIDYGFDVKYFEKGAWLEKNAYKWYSLYKLPQKTIQLDITKHIHEDEGVVLDI